MLDSPHNLEVIDIGFDWVYLSWEDLLISTERLKHSYRVTCKNDTELSFVTNMTSYNVTGLRLKEEYNCSVVTVAVSGGNWSTSLRSHSWNIVPGIFVCLC